MKLIVEITTFITCSKLRLLAHKFSWWIKQWNFNYSLSRLPKCCFNNVTSPDLESIIECAPSATIPDNFNKSKLTLAHCSKSLDNMSLPLVWSDNEVIPINFSIISNSCVIPRTNINWILRGKCYGDPRSSM